MTSHREKLALNQCPDLQMNISISWETFYENWLTYINNLWKIDCNLRRRIKFLHFNFIYTIKSFSLEILENIAMKANWMYSTVSLLSDAWVWNIQKWIMLMKEFIGLTMQNTLLYIVDTNRGLLFLGQKATKEKHTLRSVSPQGKGK